MKIIILSLSLFFVACTTSLKTEREPAQSLENYFHVVNNQKKLFLTSYVVLSSPDLSAEQLREVKRSCRAQMVLKMLQVSENLKALHHPAMDLRVSDIAESWTSGGKYFIFNLVGTDNNKYNGYMYIAKDRDENKIDSSDTHHVYQCYQGQDGRMWDFAQMHDQHKTLVFSSSAAQRYLNGEKVDERGKSTVKRKKK